MSVKLLNGQTAELKDVTHGIEVDVVNLMRRTQREFELDDDASDYIGQFLLLTVESWSLEAPLTLDGIRSVKPRIVDALYAEAMKNYKAETEDSLPQA